MLLLPIMITIPPKKSLVEGTYVPLLFFFSVCLKMYKNN